MKAYSSQHRVKHCLRQMVGACFGQLNVSLPKIGRPHSGKGGTTVISGPQGIYFLHGKMR